MRRFVRIFTWWHHSYINFLKKVKPYHLNHWNCVWLITPHVTWIKQVGTIHLGSVKTNSRFRSGDAPITMLWYCRNIRFQRRNYEVSQSIGKTYSITSMQADLITWSLNAKLVNGRSICHLTWLVSIHWRYCVCRWIKLREKSGNW